MAKNKKILIKLPDKVLLKVGGLYSWDKLKLVLTKTKHKLKQEKNKPEKLKILKNKKILEIKNKKLLTKTKRKIN